MTRTVVVRESPQPARSTPTAPREDREPVAPARVSSIPAGTAVPVTLLAQIDSEHNEVGQSWTGRVTRDVVVGGQVVIPAGAAVSGVVIAMDEGDENEGNGSITIEARSIETTAGTRSIASGPISGGHSYADQGFPAKETAIGAGAGAAIGAIVGGKKGAAIGAAAGGMGGAAIAAPFLPPTMAPICAGTRADGGLLRRESFSPCTNGRPRPERSRSTESRLVVSMERASSVIEPLPSL